MENVLSPKIFGILSLFVLTAGLIPYYNDIYRGNTKPQRAAMFIFAVLSAIAFSGQFAEGAKASLIFAGTLLFNQLLLFALSIKYGMGGFDAKDKIALVLAGLILIGWYSTKSAVLALVLVTLVNTIAKILVTIKVYKYPYSDLLYSWYMAAIASVLGALAVGGWNWILLLVPVHNAVTVGIIALTITVRKRQVKRPNGPRLSTNVA